MSINRLVLTASGALLGVVLLSAILFAFAINTIRIGGRHERKIELAAELQADVLPPPLFVVTPYAIAMEGFSHDEVRATSLDQLQKMRSDYEARKRYWADAPLEPQIRSVLDKDIATADRFWAIIDQKVVPVLQSGDKGRYGPAMDALYESFSEQEETLGGVLTATEQFKSDTHAQAKSALHLSSVGLIGLGLLMLGGVLTFARLLRKRVVSPLAELTEAANSLSAGHMVEVPHLGRGDELGQLASAFDHFVRTSAERQEVERRDAAEKKAMVDELATILTRISEGDLRKVLETEFKGDYGVVGENLNKAINSLRDMVQQVVTSASSIQLAAGEIAAASDDLSSRTQSNAAAIEQTTAALTDVGERVSSTRDAAQSTAQSAERAKSAVELGLSKARSAAATMEEVREAAASVDGVMEALDKIAFQTRVLAMNAAVEAGHAGEVGKGFAVVADLVSQLAARAEEEARNAREQLTATTERIAQAVEGVSEVEVQFSEIVTDVVTVTELVDQLSADARAQASAVEEISTAMRQMDISTQQNAAMVEETSAAAANLLGDAGELVRHAEQFRWDRRERALPVPVERRGRPRLSVAA